MGNLKIRKASSRGKVKKSHLFPPCTVQNIKHHTPLLFAMGVSQADRKGMEISYDVSSVEPRLPR